MSDSISIYQIYFDEETKNSLDSSFISYLQNKQDDFGENYIIQKIYENQDRYSYAKEKYIGITSCNQSKNTKISGSEIVKHIQKYVLLKMEKDVYLYPPTSHLKNNEAISSPSENIWEKQKSQIAVRALGEMLNISGVLPFPLFKKWIYCYGNFWIARPEIYNQYCEQVLIPVFKWLERHHTNAMLKEMVENDTSISRQQVVCGLMESLFGTYLAHSNYSYSYILKDEKKSKYASRRRGRLSANINTWLANQDRGEIIFKRKELKKNEELIRSSVKKMDAYRDFINIQRPHIAPAKKKIYTFFHICCINNYKDVVNDMLDVIIGTGLYEQNQKIFYTIIGEIDSELKSRIDKLDKFQLVHLSKDMLEVEYPTLINLHRFCQDNDAYVLYIHTKGVSLPKDEYRQYWRKRLVQKTINEYEICVSFLNEGCDVSGCGWKEVATSQSVDYNAGDYAHFSGNFWWANSDYIKRLPDIHDIKDKHIRDKKDNFLKYRLQCEFWIGMASGIKVGVNGELNKEYSNKNYYNDTSYKKTNTVI